jgi:hypothetical protein
MSNNSTLNIDEVPKYNERELIFMKLQEERKK